MSDRPVEKMSWSELVATKQEIEREILFRLADSIVTRGEKRSKPEPAIAGTIDLSRLPRELRENVIAVFENGQHVFTVKKYLETGWVDINRIFEASGWKWTKKQGEKNGYWVPEK